MTNNNSNTATNNAGHKMMATARSFGASLVITLVVMTITTFTVVSAVNYAGLRPSWRLAVMGSIALVAILVALYWASHPASHKWPGFLLAAATLVAAIWAFEALKPEGPLSPGDFAWGIADIAMVLAAAGVVHWYKFNYDPLERSAS